MEKLQSERSAANIKALQHRCKMKKLLTILAAFILCFGVLTGCGDTDKDTNHSTSQKKDTTDTSSTEKDKSTDADSSSNDDSSSEDELLSGTHHVEIDIKDYGVISVELDADTAPITVTNFINLAKDKFYDGLTFHRIISGFMIQGGDPLGTGTGGSDHEIKGEFSSNGVENNISHTRGTISMARATPPDSASSQFFIVHEDSTPLDGNYAGFGHVTDGIEIVDKICEDTPVQDGDGTVASEDQPIINSIKVID